MAKILVVDDELSFREVVYRAFETRGHQVDTALDTDHAAALIGGKRYDAVILDVVMPGESGLVFLKRIRAAQSDLPVIIYSVKVDASVEKEARMAGANEVLHKRIPLEALVERTEKVFSHFSKRPGTDPGEPKKLLVVDGDASGRGLLKSFFAKKGYEVWEAGTGEEALRRLKKEAPDVVLLDISMGGVQGIQTLKAVRALHPKLGIVVAAGDENDEKVHEAVSLGAYGYVLKPFDPLYLEWVVSSKLRIAEN